MAKKTYVVKEKDNLASLSKALGVSIRDLQQANGIRNLTPGQTLTVPASRSNGIGASGNAGGYSVTTGDNERKTINYNGTDIRLGPNSTFAPKNDKSKFQQFIDVITGNAPSQPSGTTSVRGALPSATKGIPGLAAPTQYQNRLGLNTTAGGLSTQFQGFLQNFQNVMSGQYSGNSYAQQSMAPGSLSGVPLQSNNPVTSSLVLGTNMPSYYQGPGKGINGSPMPTQNQGNGLGVNSQMGGYQSRAYTPFFNSQQLGLPAQQFSYAPQGQPNSYTPYTVNPKPATQFSYAPQGQPNSYTPYGPIQPHPAPFLTAQMLANPTYGNTVTPVTNYGSYAPGNKLYSGQAKTAQESFQQGNRNVGKRWWIGSGKTHGENNGSALAAQQAAMQAINMNPGNVQQTTWRPIY